MTKIENCALVTTARSKEQAEKEIDTFLAQNKKFEDVPLILPVSGYSKRYVYKGISVREWHLDGNVRFDAVVEILD